MSKELIYKHFGEDKQLKRLVVASLKLSFACLFFRFRGLKYLVRKLANVEFLTEQIKDYYRCEDKVYCRKYELQTKLRDEIRKAE